MNDGVILFGAITLLGFVFIFIGFYDNNLINYNFSTIIYFIISGLGTLIGVLGLTYNIFNEVRSAVRETNHNIEEIEGVIQDFDIQVEEVEEVDEIKTENRNLFN